MLDYLRGNLLAVLDRLNVATSPFEPFTRHLDTIDQRPLHEKAKLFWWNIQTFWLFGKDREFYWSMKPNDGGDMAIWHGVYVATCAFRGDWTSLSKALAGAERLQKLGGNDRLCRGADVEGGPLSIDQSRTYYKDDGYIFLDNASESTLIGHIFGLWAVSWCDVPLELKRRAEYLADALAGQLLKDGERLLNQDGSTAKFGDLRPGVTTAPIRVAALAATYALAWKLTGKQAWLRQYDKIRKSHAGALTRVETHFMWVHPWYQDVIAYMVLVVLASCDGGSYFNDYSRSMETLWSKTKHEGNSFYTFMRVVVNGKLEPEALAGAIKTLSEFNADANLGPTAKNPGKAHGGGEVDTFTWGWSWMKGGKRLSRQPVPVWRRAPQDFVWQRCPYSIGGEEHYSFNGLDFCVAYWLGVRLGVIK